jgi:F-type H+-transporting ATPase subunit b
MIDRLRVYAFLAAAALPALAALGADEHGDVQGAIATTKQGVFTAVTALVVFGLVFAILAVKVWPVIVRGLDERADKIRSEIESAEQARRQAKEALEQYQQSLAQARDEAKKMLDATKAQQSVLAAELRAKADAELADLRDRARRDIDAAKRAAIAEIYTTTANLAADMAGKILQRQWSPGDQQRMVEDSLRELQAKAN